MWKILSSYIIVQTIFFFVFYRKVRRAYQNSWDSRCKMLLCCVNSGSGKGRVSFYILTEKIYRYYFLYFSSTYSYIVSRVLIFQKVFHMYVFRNLHIESISEDLLFQWRSFWNITIKMTQIEKCCSAYKLKSYKNSRIYFFFLR